jgi:hypothetical protein
VPSSPLSRKDAARKASGRALHVVGRAHGPSGDDCFIELTVWLADRHWWVAVADAGELLPAPRNPTDDGEGGRGLLLIANLADAWGLLPRPTVGKAVYFALARPPA